MRNKLIVLSLLVLSSSSVLRAAPLSSFDDIQQVVSEGSLNPSSIESSNYSAESDRETLVRTLSSLNNMTKEQRNTLAKKLGETKRAELEKAIPKEKQDAVELKNSCCFIFWRSVFRISSKTLGNLAIDILLDLSDGKLDGVGPYGSIDYIHHIANIIDTTMEEVRYL